jgi:hypothetical protein
MKTRWLLTVLLVVFLTITFYNGAMAQCALCAKTAGQLDPKAGGGLNAGILYLMSTPLLLAGVIGYRWWRSNRDEE